MWSYLDVYLWKRWMSPHDLAMWNFRKNVFAGKSSHADHRGLIPRLLSSNAAINNTSSANLRFCAIGAMADTSNGLASIQTTHDPRRNAKVSSPGKKNQYKIPGQVRSGLAGHSPAGNGLPGRCLSESKPAVHSQHRADKTHTDKTHTHRPAHGGPVWLSSAQIW